ncbi:MAG: hypothetical protein LBH09_01855, partial [Peptococcaceae bacterium]|nr:hypothetical protein [Peptococcaceae bacterium]
MMQEANAPIHIDVALPGGVSREAPRGVLSFLEVVLAVSSVALTALILLYMTDVPYNVAALYISLAVFPAAMVFLCHKYGRISMAYLLLVIAAVCSLYYRYAWSGILVIANGFIATVNRLQGFTFILFETGVPAGLDTLYGTAALLVAIAIYSAAVAWGVTGRLAAAIFILTIPGPLLRTCLSLSLPLALLSMLGFAWVVLWIFCALDAKRKKAVNLFQKGELSLFAFMASTIAVIAAAVIALAAFSLLVPEGGAAISGGVTEARAGILSGLDRIRYEKNSGVTELPRGDLRCVESLHYTYKDVLAVSLEKPRPIYLKSFTGSAYQGNRWSGLADEAFGGDYTGIFAWLGQHSFYA